MGWLTDWGVSPPPRHRVPAQLGLHEAPRRGRGGYRANAGRKKSVPSHTRTRTPHRARPALSRHVPVHITLRAARGLPSFREQVMARAIGRAIRAMRAVREDFGIVEFSIQSNHLHLIVEAEGERALSSAIRSLQTRVTKVLNHHVLRRRRGKVWGDRYFRVDLKTPTQTRHALAYVLQNGQHHGVVAPGVKDPLSSARWSSRYVTRAELPAETSPTRPARTFMLEVLWERRWPGAILPTEIPG
jgi:putative transposase